LAHRRRLRMVFSDTITTSLALAKAGRLRMLCGDERQAGRECQEARDAAPG